MNYVRYNTSNSTLPDVTKSGSTRHRYPVCESKMLHLFTIAVITMPIFETCFARLLDTFLSSF